MQALADFGDKPDRPGILWILEEESTFPGSNDVTFLERIQTVHGEPDVFGMREREREREGGREHSRTTISHIASTTISSSLYIV